MRAVSWLVKPRKRRVPLEQSLTSKNVRISPLAVVRRRLYIRSMTLPRVTFSGFERSVRFMPPNVGEMSG